MVIAKNKVDLREEKGRRYTYRAVIYVADSDHEKVIRCYDPCREQLSLSKVGGGGASMKGRRKRRRGPASVLEIVWRVRE